MGIHPKNIYINGRFLTQPITGVQRYSLELLRYFNIFMEEKSYFENVKLICLAPHEDFVANPQWKNIEIRKIGFWKKNAWEQLDLPLYIKGQLLFSPANTGPFYYANQVVTIHDASVFAVPFAYSFAFRTKHRFIIRQLAQRSTRILTDSIFSQHELARYLGTRLERFSVIPLGSDHICAIEPDQGILQRYRLELKKYLLIVASRSPHKNFEGIVKAVKLLGTDFKIVAVGGSFSKIFKQTKSGLLPPNMIVCDYVTDQELKALYQNALGLIYPSIYEGFGLPPLEAMQCGCPVLCSQAASLPEVVGAAAVYFDPFDIENIAGVINSFLSNPMLQNQLREKGLAHSAGFKWLTTAQKTFEYLLNDLTKEMITN